MVVKLRGTKCWKWYDYYEWGLTLSACGGISMVLALPGLIVCMYYGLLDIIWLLFIIAGLICAGEILMRYGMYRKRYDEWVMFVTFLCHNEKEDSNG